MAKSLKPEALGDAIRQELTIYSKGVTERVNAAGDEHIKALVKRTKATAPKRSGDFKKAIASKAIPEGNGMNSYVWYVRPPLHRITHLLVHGHAKRNGGRVPGNSFLQDALDQVLPDYEAAIKEAIQSD